MSDYRNGKAFDEPSTTPEEIVALIGNIANRPDIREIQERQVREINALVAKYKKAVNDLVDLMEYGDFRNGNTGPDGWSHIDEGSVMAERCVEKILKSIE